MFYYIPVNGPWIYGQHKMDSVYYTENKERDRKKEDKMFVWEFEV